jgi:glycosyltransferase involved in cell wall biosynthesis
MRYSGIALSERHTRWLAGGLLLAACFPYFSPQKTPFDTQPWTLIVAGCAFLLLFGDLRPFGSLFFVAAYAGLVFGIGLVRGTSIFADGLRSLAGYLSVVLIAFAAFRLHRDVSAKLFLGTVAVWFAATWLQILIAPDFLNFLVPRNYPIHFQGRGFTSLAPEPFYCVKVAVAFFVLNEIFYKERRYKTGPYLAVAAACVFMITATLTGISVVYLLAAPAAKLISFVWEDSRKRRIEALGVAFAFLAPLVFYLVVPSMHESRAGRYAERALINLSELYRGIHPTDKSVSTRLGNLVWGFYGGIVETKGLGFGLASPLKEEVPPWLKKVIGFSRRWGGRIGGGLVQGVYELGVVGLIFFFVPVWIIFASFWKNQPMRSALWMTFSLVLPATIISESPGFPLFGYLLGVHGFYLIKAKEARTAGSGVTGPGPGRAARKKVLVLNQYFPPDVASTGQYAFDIASGFFRAGNDVHVVAGQPSYVAAPRHAPAEEILDGLHVHRVAMGKSRGRERMGVRVRGYLTFLVRARRRVRALAAEIPFTAVVSFHNPPFLGLIAAGLVPAKVPRFIFVSYDIHPDALLVAGWKIPRFAVRLWNRANRRIYGRAESIVVLVEGARRILHRSYGVPLDKIRVIPLWGKPEFEPLPPDVAIREELGIPSAALLLLYAGNMGIMHPLEEVLEAAVKLRDEDVYFLFLGEGVKRRSLVSQAEKLGLAKVVFLPYQPDDRFVRILSAADACFVSFGPGMEQITIPSRAYTFLSAGKPLITLMAAEAEVAGLVKENACGWNVTSGAELAALGRRLRVEPAELDRAAKAARAVYVQSYRQDLILEQYARLLTEP